MEFKLNRHDLVLLAIYLNLLPDNYRHFSMDVLFSVPDMYADYDQVAPVLKEKFGKIDRWELALPIEIKECKYAIGDCGTAACAIGHAPSVKGTRIVPYKDESYAEYSRRFLFGSEDPLEFDDAEEVDMCWHWVFSQEWTNIDNTPRGAAKRIMHLVRMKDDDLHELAYYKFIAELEYNNFDIDVTNSQKRRYTEVYENEKVPNSLEEFIAEYSEV